MNIEQLLENVTESIEDENIKQSNVGNRPHYPVFVAINGASSNDCSSFYNVIRGMWSAQICKHLLIYKYGINADSTISFSDTKDDSIAIESLYERISETAKTRDVFEDLSVWCFYNIIDTAYLNSFEDFQKAFDSLKEFRNIIYRNTKSMAIIILRESRDISRSKLNYQIREALMNETAYEGIVLLSTLTRGGREFDVHELYAISANLVLLSNNDAVTSTDDKDYVERNIKLYSKTPLILSYNFLKKPTYKILYSMTSKTMEYVDSLLEKSSEAMRTNDLRGILGIDNNRISFFDEFIKSVKNQLVRDRVHYSLLNCVPLRNPDIFTDEEFEKMRFSEYKGCIYQDSFELIIKNYANSLFISEDCQQLLQSYEQKVFESITLDNVNSVSIESIKGLFQATEDLHFEDESETLDNYFNNRVISSLKFDYIYPYCMNLVLQLCDSEKIKIANDNIASLKSDIIDNMPVAGFDQISEEYGKQMSAFLVSDMGRKCIGSILKISNGKDELYQALRNTLAEADKYSRGTIKIPYIQMWANALKLQGQDIFSKIRMELSGDGHKGIMLYGSYPAKEVLNVYMLHTTDKNGQNPTQLYTQFNEAFRHVSNIQFFNTGNDDAIESIQFYRCEGTDLILGINSYD